MFKYWTPSDEPQETQLSCLKSIWKMHTTASQLCFFISAGRGWKPLLSVSNEHQTYFNCVFQWPVSRVSDQACIVCFSFINHSCEHHISYFLTGLSATWRSGYKYILALLLHCVVRTFRQCSECTAVLYRNPSSTERTEASAVSLLICCFHHSQCR